MPEQFDRERAKIKEKETQKGTKRKLVKCNGVNAPAASELTGDKKNLCDLCESPSITNTSADNENNAELRVMFYMIYQHIIAINMTFTDCNMI